VLPIALHARGRLSAAARAGGRTRPRPGVAASRSSPSPTARRGRVHPKVSVSRPARPDGGSPDAPTPRTATGSISGSARARERQARLADDAAGAHNVLMLGTPGTEDDAWPAVSDPSCRRYRGGRDRGVHVWSVPACCRPVKACRGAAVSQPAPYGRGRPHRRRGRPQSRRDRLAHNGVLLLDGCRRFSPGYSKHQEPLGATRASSSRGTRAQWLHGPIPLVAAANLPPAAVVTPELRMLADGSACAIWVRPGPLDRIDLIWRSPRCPTPEMTPAPRASLPPIRAACRGARPEVAGSWAPQSKPKRVLGRQTRRNRKPRSRRRRALIGPGRHPPGTLRTGHDQTSLLRVARPPSRPASQKPSTTEHVAEAHPVP